MRLQRLTPMLLAVTLTVAGAAAAAGYGLTAPKRYDAKAAVLVAPVSGADPTFAGLDIFRDVNGKHTAAASAAALVRTPEVADAVDTQLGLERSRDSLLANVHARVVGDSDVVEVTASDSSADGAARLANAFVDALIARRTATFQSQLASAIARDRQLLASGSADERAQLSKRLATLRGFVGQADPTVRRASSATAPSSAAWPGWLGLILTGALSGLALAAVLSLTLAVWRRRVRWHAEGPLLPPGGSDDPSVQAFVDRLEHRLVARESALAVRERELRERIEELRALEPQQELVERERQLEERVAAVTKREVAIARAAAAAAPVSNGTFNLDVLERLVSEQGAAHPDRLEEWRSYLFFLRDYAGVDGNLPHSFDFLVEETFRPLLN